MRWVRLALAVALAGCRPVNCRGMEPEPEELPLVPYEVVSPCVYRYYGEPARPGFAAPEVNGIAYGGYSVNTRQHLVTFTSCDPDAGIQGKVELRYVFTSEPPAF